MNEEDEYVQEEAYEESCSSCNATLSLQKGRNIQSLFQITFGIGLHQNGRKRTPMHIMNAESVHSLGRGGKVITTV